MTLVSELGVAPGKGAWWNSRLPVAICFLKPLKSEQEVPLGSSQTCLWTLPFSVLWGSRSREGPVMTPKSSPSQRVCWQWGFLHVSFLQVSVQAHVFFLLWLCESSISFRQALCRYKRWFLTSPFFLHDWPVSPVPPEPHQQDEKGDVPHLLRYPQTCPSLRKVPYHSSSAVFLL